MAAPLGTAGALPRPDGGTTMSTSQPFTFTDEQLRDALSRRPDAGQLTVDLAELFSAVGRTPQRRSAIVRLTSRLRWPRSTLAFVTVLALLLLLGLAFALLVGSRRPPAPPFGPARPGIIAFDTGGRIYVANQDGTGRRQLTSGPYDGDATFSPDGTLIAYATQGDDRSTSIVIVGDDGRHPVTVAEHLADVGGIAWSPDSRHLVFGARHPQTSQFRVFTAGLDQPGAAQLGGRDVYGIEPSWSPDGRTIAFKRFVTAELEPQQSVYSDGTLWLIDADGTHLRALTTDPGGAIEYWGTQWSPDGRRLAFLAAGVGGALDVFVIDADGTHVRDLSNDPEDEAWPSWSPDGTRIAFARMRPAVLNQGAVVVADPDGSHRVELAGPPVNSNTLIWSPDGKRILAYAKNPDPAIDQNVAIAILDPTGSAPPVTIPAADLSSASWQRLAP